ncbi:MAG: RHS repeat protein [Candidatus Omnitrophica bacterium]|nr:RHS repeat protein [Candidatus Omnitrophota bacterium]
MMKKIILFLMMLLSGLSWIQSTAANGKISSFITEDKTVFLDNCYFTACATHLMFWFHWTKTPAANGKWDGPVVGTQATGPWENLGTVNDYHRVAHIVTLEAMITQSQIEQFEQSINDAHYTASENFIPTNGPPTFISSSFAQIANPSNAPLNSKDLIFQSIKSITNDPVDIFSGEDFFSSTDFSLSSQGPKLNLSRHYRSFSTFTGMFGYGWRTDFDVNLTQDNSGNVIIFDGEGTGIYFMNNSGIYTPSPGNYSTIVKNADNTFSVTDKNGKATHYDINGRLSSVKDRHGNMLTFVYNPAVPGGTYIQDASGRQIVLNVDLNGHIISATDPAGKNFQYGYDINGNLVSVTDPSGAITKYIYDDNHKVVQFINANGHNTYYQYDTEGRATMNWRDDNVNKVTLDYQANNTTVVTDSLGKKTTYVFNGTGLEISHTDPLGAVTQQTWDVFMNRTSITDAKNNVTKFDYDYYGNLIQITDPLGKQTNMTYTPDFNLISTKTDALGQVIKFDYDVNGNPNTITDALGNKQTFVYDQHGNVISATDSRGNMTHFTYDALGHVIQKTNALGNSTNFTYK